MSCRARSSRLSCRYRLQSPGGERALRGDAVGHSGARSRGDRQPAEADLQVRRGAERRRSHQDYLVFVHVLDDQGERLWGDDHPPALPTSTWKPGQKVEYTRTVFVPELPVHRPGARPARPLLAVGQPAACRSARTEMSRREYEVAKFQLLPQSENIFLIYKDGWHPAEVSSQDPTNEWQWTKKAATISFRNPKKDATFYLEFDARTDQFSAAPAGHRPFGRSGDRDVPRRLEGAQARDVPVTAAQLGTARHGGADARRRSDVRRPAAATSASSASGSSTPSSSRSSRFGGAHAPCQSAQNCSDSGHGPSGVVA